MQAHVDGLNKCATQQLSRRRLSAVLPFQLLFSRDPRSSYGSTTPESIQRSRGGVGLVGGDEIGRSMAAPRPAKRARTEPTIRLSGGTAVPDGLLTQWREGGVFCDAEIVVGDTTIKAHRCVLGMASDYFKALFTAEMRDAHGPLVLEDIEPSSCKAAVEFMYLGECALSSHEQLVPVFEASERMQITPLRDSAVKAIRTRRRGGARERAGRG